MKKLLPLLVVVAFMAIAVSEWLLPQSDVVPFSVMLPCLVGALATNIVLHELGHAAAARIAGWGVLSINLGPLRFHREDGPWRVARGTRLSRFSVVTTYPSADLGRRSLLVASGGLAMNALLAAGSIAVLRLGSPPDWVVAALVEVAGVAILYGGVNALPIRDPVSGLRSDGNLIFALLLRNRGALADMLETDAGGLMDLGRRVSEGHYSTPSIVRLAERLPELRLAHFVAFIRVAEEENVAEAKKLVERFVREPLPDDLADLVLGHAAAWLALVEGDVPRAQRVLAQRPHPDFENGGWFFDAAVAHADGDVEATRAALASWQQWSSDERPGNLFWIVEALRAGDRGGLNSGILPA